MQRLAQLCVILFALTQYAHAAGHCDVDDWSRICEGRVCTYGQTIRSSNVLGLRATATISYAVDERGSLSQLQLGFQVESPFDTEESVSVHLGQQDLGNWQPSECRKTACDLSLMEWWPEFQRSDILSFLIPRSDSFDRIPFNIRGVSCSISTQMSQ